MCFQRRSAAPVFPAAFAVVRREGIGSVKHRLGLIAGLLGAGAGAKFSTAEGFAGTFGRAVGVRGFLRVMLFTAGLLAGEFGFARGDLRW